MTEAVKSHQLRLTLETEGFLTGKIICPYGGFDAPSTAPCSIYDWDENHEDWLPVGGCWVMNHFDEIGIEAWKGTLELPVIDIDYHMEGSGEDGYLESITARVQP